MKIWVMLVGVMLVSGCQLFSQQDACQYCNAETAEQREVRALQQLAGGNYLPNVPSTQLRPGKPLSDYAADLALQLMLSMQYQLPQQAVAITSFVQFDEQLSTAGALGNQLSEHMYFQLQRLGVPVADVRLAQQIRVSPYGDFVLSRGAYLDIEQQARYVLTGTMLRDNAGVVVNARIMQLKNKALLASAQIHIPHFVLSAPKIANTSQLPKS
jgi:TolB-like protein